MPGMKCVSGWKAATLLGGGCPIPAALFMAGNPEAA